MAPSLARSVCLDDLASLLTSPPLFAVAKLSSAPAGQSRRGVIKSRPPCSEVDVGLYAVVLRCKEPDPRVARAVAQLVLVEDAVLGSRHDAGLLALDCVLRRMRSPAAVDGPLYAGEPGQRATKLGPRVPGPGATP